MLGLGRVSFSQRFHNTVGNIRHAQTELTVDYLKLNSGNRLLRLYESPYDSIQISRMSGKLSQIDNQKDLASVMSSRLDLSERVLDDIKVQLDTIKSEAVNGASESYSGLDRQAFAQSLEATTENILRLFNTKFNGEYIFSGEYVKVPTVDFNIDSVFSSVSYVNELDPPREKSIHGQAVSVDVQELLRKEAQPAIKTSKVDFSASTLAVAGDIRIVINNGYGKVYDTLDINLAAGDDLTTIINKINTQANLEGLPGAIAQENPVGYLSFDTSLVDPNRDSAIAQITISEGTNPGNVFNELGLDSAPAQGVTADLSTLLAELDHGYRTNDTETIRNVIGDLDVLITKAVDLRVDSGRLLGNIQDDIESTERRELQLELKRSELKDIEMTDAIVETNRANAAYQQLLRNASALFETSIMNFL